MTKKFETEKLKITGEVLRTPECIDCFERIANHANGVLGSLEVHSEEVLNNIEVRSDELSEHFERKTEIAIVQIGIKTDEAISSYLKNQELKHDKSFEDHLEKQVRKEDVAFSKHLEKQATKYDNFEKKVLGIIKWVLGIMLGIVLLCSGIVGVTWIIVQSKANKIEVLSLEDAKIIIDLGDKYRDQRYVMRTGETIDKYNYKWYIETVFARASRGEKTTTRLEDELKSK